MMDHRAHYERLAPSFTRHWSYTPEFVTWMTGCLADRLQLRDGITGAIGELPLAPCG